MRNAWCCRTAFDASICVWSLMWPASSNRCRRTVYRALWFASMMLDASRQMAYPYLCALTLTCLTSALCIMGPCAFRPALFRASVRLLSSCFDLRPFCVSVWCWCVFQPRVVCPRVFTSSLLSSTSIYNLYKVRNPSE